MESISPGEQGFRTARWNTLVMALIGAVILSYAVYRAAVASFTHDESFTYLQYAHDDGWDLYTMAEPYTNNHVLNSLGMKYASLVFGDSELALRLPNLLLLVVYMVYAGLLFRNSTMWIAIPAFVVLCTSTVMIELFTLARGYGLSFGFMLMAVYHATRVVRSGGRWHIVAFHLAMALAVLANFTMLPVYVSGLATFLLIALLRRKHDTDHRRISWRAVITHVVMLVAMGAFLWAPVHSVLRANTFDFGGQGFYGDTVRTMVHASVPAIPMGAGLLLVLQVIYTLVVVMAGVIVMRRALAGDRDLFQRDSEFAICTILLIMVCAALVAQHLLIGSGYPEARFAIYLLPLFLLVVMFLLRYVNLRWGTRSAAYCSIALGLFSAWSFHRTSSPYRSSEWPYDVQTDEAMSVLRADLSARGGSDTVRIGNSWYLEPALNFYRETWKMIRLAPAHRDGLDPMDDYRYLHIDDPHHADTLGYERIATFEHALTVLYHRKGV